MTPKGAIFLCSFKANEVFISEVVIADQELYIFVLVYEFF